MWLAVVLGIIVVLFAWIDLRAHAARHSLYGARTAISRMRADLVAGRDPTRHMQDAQRDASAARRDTHDPIWAIAAWLPPVKTVRGVTDAVADLSNTSLPALGRIAPTVQPSKLRSGPHTISLAPLQAAAPVLTGIERSVEAAQRRIGQLPAGWFGSVRGGRQQALKQLSSLHGSIDAAARFATIGPGMLGADGTRRYFVGVQNNAEARATGGLVAAYAIVTADHGRIKVVKRGNDGDLKNSATPVVTLGKEYDEEYGNYETTRKWIYSNTSPDFPAVGNIWAHLWEAQSGQHIDGSFAVDPVALASLLQATGPVRLKGYPKPFTGNNLARFIESTEYKLYPDLADNSARKDFVSKVAGAVLHHLLSDTGRPSTIVAALGKSAGEQHLALWSAHPAEQAMISGTPLSGEIPRTSAPFVSVSVDNGTGSKLDYYLDRTVTYEATSCDEGDGRRTAHLTVQLTNSAPAHGLPPYVMARGDHGRKQVETESTAQNFDFVLIHVTQGDYLTDATLDGKPLLISPGVEAGHPVYFFTLTLNPGRPRTIRLTLSEPHPKGKAVIREAPLARPQVEHVSVPTCT